MKGIAAALEDAIRKSPEELAAMGERGRAVVAERFAWETTYKHGCAARCAHGKNHDD